ncbi:MAG: hypothetical protein ACJA01_002605 [Saprospiraceae bacterium]|jgi:hypothetical protein
MININQSDDIEYPIRLMGVLFLKYESTPESHNIGKRPFWRYFHYSQLPDAQASPRFKK